MAISISEYTTVFVNKDKNKKDKMEKLDFPGNDIFQKVFQK